MSSALLQDLNPAQQTAVQFLNGPALVLAGPGSGKTRVLVHRIAFLVSQAQVGPQQIMAVTFTNKAAREMKERLTDLLGIEQAALLTVGTFHSLCARFLRRDIIHLGRERDFVIYDSDDQERLIRRVLKDLNLNEKKNPPRAILSAISSAKNELVSVQEYARLNQSYFGEIVTRCYEHYQALLRESNALDFNDLLFETVRLFEQHPDILAHYHRRYHYLLVDEYQDTNRAQYALVRQLATAHRNLFVVGDEDQSIYAWRGADIRNILEFEKDYPEAHVILLEQNYRSTQSILEIAQAVISGGTQRKHPKQLWTQNVAGVKVSLIEGYDQNDEAQRVAGEIVRLIASEDYKPGDMAIMYRTNAQSRAIEEALSQRRLPYQLIGGTRFYERKEVKDSLAYLRLMHNPFDSVSLERIINTPPRGIGDKTVTALQRWAADLGVPMFQALRELANDDPTAAPSPFSGRARKALLGFLATIEELLTARHQIDLPDLFDMILERVGLRAALLAEYGEDEGEERWANVQELRGVATEYTGLRREAQLATFLEEVSLVSDIDTLDRQTNVVTCITLHQAKGLEYPVVFLIGLEDGLLPHRHALNDIDNRAERLEEERRLFYVGATRAQQRLYLLYAFRRVLNGRMNVSTPSMFLKSIPRDLMEQPIKRQTTTPQRGMLAALLEHPAPPEQQLPDIAFSDNTSTQRKPAAAPDEISFFPGQRVFHQRFGEGEVISSKLTEDDEEVIVRFASGTEKRLLASFARLQAID